MRPPNAPAVPERTGILVIRVWVDRDDPGRRGDQPRRADGHTIANLLDGSPGYQGKASDPLDKPASGGETPLEVALSTSNIHHYLVGAQGALPVDAAGNPWSGSYVYNSGNLVLDLLYNLMLESTGRLQQCRL